jgi:hypothetical protein
MCSRLAQLLRLSQLVQPMSKPRKRFVPLQAKQGQLML